MSSSVYGGRGVPSSRDIGATSSPATVSGKDSGRGLGKYCQREDSEASARRDLGYFLCIKYGLPRHADDTSL